MCVPFFNDLFCSVIDLLKSPTKFANNPELATRFPNAKTAIAGNTEQLITYVEDRAGHDRRYAIDATKTNEELGYVPAESFETGFAKTLNWYLDNEAWWQPLLGSSKC